MSKTVAPESTEWTKPYHTVQHFGDPMQHLRWATVSGNEVATLSCWTTAEAGFSPPSFTFYPVGHRSFQAAREAGKVWARTGHLPTEGENVIRSEP